MEIGTGPILLGEDLEDDALLFTLSMKKAGVLRDIIVIGDGDQIIDYLRGVGSYADRTKYPKPSMIFLDGQLHHQPSMGLLKWIKDHPNLTNVPVIVLTGSLDEKVSEQAKALGALECFEKPFTRQYWQKIEQMVT